MTRKLDVGEHGEIVCTAQRRAEGKWRTVPSNETRKAERWRARAVYRGYDGVKGDVTRVATTKKAAVAAIEMALAELLSGAQSEIKATTPFVTVARAWLVEVGRSDSNLATSTQRLYTQCVTRYIDAPGSGIRGLTLGQMNSPARIRAFLQGVADKHGTATARTCKSVISSILNFALNDGVISVNAARQVRPVRSQKPQERMRPRDTSRAFTPFERDRALSVADALAADANLDPRTQRKRQAVADLIAFMCGTGARIGEVRGLRWEHLHLDEGYVRLHGTKSATARRRIDLPSWLVERLEGRVRALSSSYRDAAQNAKGTDELSRSEVVAQYRQAADQVGSAGFVFPSPAHADGERAWDQSNSSNAVRAVLDEAGLDWATAHSFRRTVATRLAEAGAPLSRIADLLGHSDPSMTASVYLGRDFEGDKSDLAAFL